MLLPNIVILFVDDMGSNQVNVPIATTHNFHSYTGDNHTITTPNVARLASEGMLFETSNVLLDDEGNAKLLQP